MPTDIAFKNKISSLPFEANGIVYNLFLLYRKDQWTLLQMGKRVIWLILMNWTFRVLSKRKKNVITSSLTHCEKRRWNATKTQDLPKYQENWHCTICWNQNSSDMNHTYTASVRTKLAITVTELWAMFVLSLHWCHWDFVRKWKNTTKRKTVNRS